MVDELGSNQQPDMVAEIQALRKSDQELSEKLKVIMDQPTSKLKDKAIKNIEARKKPLWEKIYKAAENYEKSTGKKIFGALQASEG